jgi:heme-degrading monooxygenase HmoA
VEHVYARLTRYEGGSPEAIDETLEAKRRVLPTEPGQTEGMKGAIFFKGADSGTVLVVSLWEDADAMEASEGEASRLREEVTAQDETATVERYEVALFAVEQSPSSPPT